MGLSCFLPNFTVSLIFIEIILKNNSTPLYYCTIILINIELLKHIHKSVHINIQLDEFLQSEHLFNQWPC